MALRTLPLLRRFSATLAAAFVILGAGVPPAAAPPPATDAILPATPNPSIAEACGIDVTLVLDASGSIQSAGAVGAVRSAADAFLTALADTSSTARVIDFGTNARQTAPRTVVTTASLTPGGVFGQAIAAYYNPIPPFPTGVAGHSYKGNNLPVNVASSFSNGSSVQYTNWDDALNRTATAVPQLVVFVTDGAPNAVVDDHPGDPFYRAGDATPDVRYGLDGNTAANELSANRAIEEANRIKTAGGRMLAVGVGDAFGNTANIDHLKQVTNGPGSNVVTNAAGITDLNTVDVALVSDFDELGQALREVVTQLCSPSLTILKLAQSASDASYQPAPGWAMTVTPTVTAPGTPPYRWILPVANAPVGAQTTTTNGGGFAQFQWEPNPPSRSSTATVTETNQTGFTPRDWSCKAKNPDGSVVNSSGAFGAGPPTFTVTVGPEQIVTCTVRNDFNYAPSGVVTKVNNPRIVRGDGNGTSVTSTYTATNTGNTPLSPVAGTDTKCAPVDYIRVGGAISGDTNNNELVDPGETWRLSCSRVVQHALTDADVVVPNTVTLSGRAPNGVLVTGTAADEIQVLTPDITIEKTVSPTSGLSPLDVTYTYTVSTNGNTPIDDVTLADDTPPCSTAANVTFTGGDTANPGFLDPGETWTYTCAAPGLTAGVVNHATVSGQPVTPVAPLVPGTPLTAIGARVNATDDAEVTVATASLGLVKTASPKVGFPGTPITYTFEVSNAATNTATLVPQTTRDAVVADSQCSPLTYQSGDTNDDSRMEPGETWTYTCTRTYPTAGLKPNLATATMATEGTGVVLTKTDPAAVLIVAPAIHIEKRASTGLIHSGDSVTYEYDVTNPGFAPLDAVTVTDNAGPGTCAPVTFVGGDDDSNGLLDHGELWQFTCTTTVTKSAPSTTPEDVPNTATATGTPTIGSVTAAPISDSDPATVTVIDPSIAIVKTADPTEIRLPGGSVTWTATVTNTGDSPLYEVVVSDDTCSPMVLQSGDTGNDGIADPGEAWVYTCQGLVTSNTTNTASVTADDILDAVVTASDPADVTTFEASIELVKTPSAILVLSGASVTYTFVATNTGTDPLHGIVLTDDTCAPLSAPSGDTGGDGIMDPAEAWTYTCNQPITAVTTNVADVSGLDHTGTKVRAEAEATVTPFITGIHVAKTATPTVLYGPGTVHYRYAVTNTGNVPLSDVASRIVDDTCSPLTYQSGDTDANDLLTSASDIFETGPAETWIFTCSMTISTDTTNTVVAMGTPTDPGADDPVLAPDVADQDTAAVQVLAPGSITIVKRLRGGDGDAAFEFTGDLGPFTLTTSGGTASQTFTDLQPGRYDVTEQTTDGWFVSGITCDDPSGGSSGTGQTARIRVDGSEDVTCTFTNDPVPPTSVGATIAVGPIRIPMDPIGRLLPPPLRTPAGYGLLGIALVAGLLGGIGSLLYLRRRSRLPTPSTTGRTGDPHG